MGLFIYVMRLLNSGDIVTDGDDIGIIVGSTVIIQSDECYIVYDPKRHAYHIIEADYLEILISDGELQVIII
jgi:hypothetical protein